MSRVVVIEKDLKGVGDQGEDLYGQADLDTRTVWIDPQQSSRKYMGTLVHEHIHLLVGEIHCEGCGACQDEWPEERVVEWENLIADNLWAAGYRRIQQ
jgi:hypothetical protein